MLNQELIKPFSPDYETIKRLEERSRSILDTIEEGYVEVDLKGTTTFCNNSFCKIMGFTMQELIGMNYRDYMTENVAKATYIAYNNVFKTRIPNKGFYYEIIRKDGLRRIIENSISLIMDTNGDPIGFRSVVRDITDRMKNERELEMHRSHLKAIFEGVKDAIITFDSGMKAVVEANKAAENVCGFDIQKNIGRKFSECITQCEKNCFTAIQDFLESGSNNMECQICCDHRYKGGQKVTIRGSHLLSPTEGIIGTVFVIRDITRIKNLEQELRGRFKFRDIIGQSYIMQNIYDTLWMLADLNTTVLLTGGSGTGKSLIARALHYNGNRAQKPLVTVNCAVLPESLLESELFGHVKGSFTGAIRDMVGRFQAAADGTIILDEIGDISPRIQLKLLRVLEEREFERVGESAPMKCDARVIACTNQDLKRKVQSGEFREDLYYRLKVMEVKIPSLSERKEDIPLLVAHFMDVFNKNMSKKIEKLSEEVMNVFMEYSWPGNVRELRHALEHAFILCHDSVIELKHLPVELRGHFDSRRRVSKKEAPACDEEGIKLILEKTYWNKAKAARLLGVDRSTLYRKMRKYRITK